MRGAKGYIVKPCQGTKSAYFAIALLLLLVACTKSLPFKEEFKKPELTDKVLIDAIDADTKNPGSEYIYLPSSGNVTRTSTLAANTRPYFFGAQKRVKFKFTETDLQVLEIDSQEKFADNSSNLKLVMSIPVEHVEYRCAQDRKGSCQNKEEQNNEIPWNKKAKFLPHFKDTKFVETSLLPIELNKVFGESCYKLENTRLLKYEIEEDAINIKFEKVFVGDPICLQELGIPLDNYSDLTTTSVFNYSFAKLKKIASPNYIPVEYNLEDENIFGYLSDSVIDLDVDGRKSLKGEKRYLNRRNPRIQNVVYNVSPEFLRQGNEFALRAVQNAFDSANSGLLKAAIGIRLSIDSSQPVEPGDLRRNMLILVEDPVVGLPSAYGPAVSDPRTGEILSSTVVIYKGALIQSLGYAFDSLVRDQLYLNKQNGPSIRMKSSEVEKQAASAKVMSEYNSKLANYVSAKVSKAKEQTAAHNPQKDSEPSRAEQSSIQEINSEISSTKDENYLAAMTKYCLYPSEMLNFDSALSQIAKKDSYKNKLWKDLSETEKQSIINSSLPEIIASTTLHELGHNLGLRHNFRGSQDRANFYSQSELAALGLKNTASTSSVMDYLKTAAGPMNTFGKYDIGALRFGYRREIEDRKGKLLEIKKDIQSLKLTLGKDESEPFKEFLYCSDEEVELNADCKQHDEGSTYTEIVQSQIATYHRNYTLLNFRGSALQFSMINDARAIDRVKNIFKRIRAAKEYYEMLKGYLGVTDDENTWNALKESTETYEKLKDLKRATLLSADFFIEVIETPDVLCAIGKVSDPTTVTRVTELEKINSGLVSCDQLKLNEGLIVVGQSGRFFNSKKDLRNRHNNSKFVDQIDVRGIWMDKILAAKMLFERKSNNRLFDKILDNYLDIDDVRPKVLKMLEDMLRNTVVKDIQFKSPSGGTFTLPGVHFDLFGVPGLDQDDALSQFLTAPYSKLAAAKLDIPLKAQSFQKILMDIFCKDLISDPKNAAADKVIADQFSIYKTDRIYQVDKASDGKIIDLGTDRYVAYSDNEFAFGIFKQLLEINTLNSLTQEELQLVISKKMAETKEAPALAPSDASDLVKQAFGIPVATLNAFQNKKLPEIARLSYILKMLPIANLSN